MITRTRLLERLSLTEPMLWLIEAGAGFGKTVLLDQLRTQAALPALVTRRPIGPATIAAFNVELAGAARRAGVDDVEAAIAGADGDPVAIARALTFTKCCLFVDDADVWDDEVVVMLAAVLDEVAGRMPCVIAARSLASFEQFRTKPHVRSIASAELSFTAAEIEELMNPDGGARGAADLILKATGGWPLAVASLVTQFENTTEPRALSSLAVEHENLIDGLLRSYLDDLDEADIAAAVELAGLPFFDEDLCALVGSHGLLERLTAAGVPLTKRSDGWIELAEQFRQSLLQRGPTPGPTEPPILDHYVARGEINAAISVCLGRGSHEQVAELVAGLTNDQQTRLEPSTLNAAIATIGEAVAHAPRCLVVQALVNGTFGRMPDGLRAVERAEAYFAAIDPDLQMPDHQEALLELGLWRCFTGQTGSSWRLLERVAAELGATSRVDLLARAHDLRGLLLQDGGTEEALASSATEMTEALRLWRSIAEPRPAAATVFRLAGGVLADLGQRGAALDILENLPSIGPMTLINRARLGLEQSALLPYLGRATEVPAIVAEVRRLARLLGHDWIVSWSYWTEIVAISAQGVGERARELVAEHDALAVRIGDEQTEAVMWCDVAEALARCGLHDDANEILGRARALPSTFPWLIDYTEASIEARGGDALRALTMIEELDLISEIEHDRRWRIELLRAVSQLRNGSVEDAMKFLDRAFELAADLGQPRLPHHIDAALVEQIRTGEMATPRATTSEHPTTIITLFDEFAVTFDGAVIELPRGQVSSLVKLLVLGGGSLVVDQVIDRLWPDASLDTGRRRVRNLLGRLRENCPDLVERDGESLRLGSGVGSDLATAQQAAQQALAHMTPAALDGALTQNQRELLPANRYDDWAEEARSRQRDLVIRLLDAKTALSEQSGDVDGMVSALLEAHRLDPRGSRQRTAADLLRSVGREVAAAALDDNEA